MNDISPKAEPVGWATAIGLIVAALASYGLPITSELAQALVVVVPVLIAAWVARQHVSPVGKVDAAYRQGLDDAQGDTP